MTKSRPLATLTLISAFLPGCSDHLSSTQCVKTLLVSSLSRAPLYTVSAEDPRSLVISDFKSGCGGATPDLPGAEGDIGMSMRLTVPEARLARLKHGQASKSNKIILPLFVALLDEEDNVLDRRDENIELTISKKGLNQTYKIAYHLPDNVDSRSSEHHILVGINGNMNTIHGKGHS